MFIDRILSILRESPTNPQAAAPAVPNAGLGISNF